MYRISAKPRPALVDPPVDALDRIHRVLDRYPLGIAFAVAVLQVASGLFVGIAFALWD